MLIQEIPNENIKIIINVKTVKAATNATTESTEFVKNRSKRENM